MDTIQALEKKIEELSEQLHKKSALVEALAARAAERETLLQALTFHNKDQEAQVQSLFSRLDEQTKENRALAHTLALRESEAAEYALSRSWRITRPLRKGFGVARDLWGYLRNFKTYRAIGRSGFFDACYYLRNYPNVRHADVDPLVHFIEQGWKDGQSPSEKFDTADYLANYADVAAGGNNPLLHYLNHGVREGREAKPGKLLPPEPVYKGQPPAVVEREWQAAQALAEALLAYPADAPVAIAPYPPSAHRPRVSVCIPVYNGGEYLRASINSVLCQSYPDFELLIVDDASTDDSGEIAQSFNDPRIRYVKNEHNLGLVGNWNRCLDLACGEYITLFHQDDLMTPYNLAMKAAVLDAQPSVGLVYSDTTVLNEDGSILQRHWFNVLEPNVDFVLPGRAFFDRMFVNLNLVNCPSVMARRACYEQAGGFDARLPFSVDMEMWMRLALFSGVAYLAEPLIHYRYHAGSQTQHYTHLDLIHVYLCKRMLLEKFGAMLDASYPKTLIDNASQRMLARAARYYEQQNITLARQYLAFLKKIRPPADGQDPLDLEIDGLVNAVNRVNEHNRPATAPPEADGHRKMQE